MHLRSAPRRLRNSALVKPSYATTDEDVNISTFYFFPHLNDFYRFILMPHTANIQILKVRRA